MVVDDSITVRRVTQRLLLREGYRVTCWPTTACRRWNACR
jgi:CheY-like chemotaxis protein